MLDGGRINLKLVSEVSELSQTGSPFTTVNGVTAILPSMTTRRIDTTVQLGDGQSFVVAGLIKNNMTEALNKFPGLGEVPVMGALFRSTEFQTDQTELMFVVTPRLVKPLTTAVNLPTDNHIVPSRGDVILMGSGEAQGRGTGRTCPPVDTHGRSPGAQAPRHTGPRRPAAPPVVTTARRSSLRPSRHASTQRTLVTRARDPLPPRSRTRSGRRAAADRVVRTGPAARP